MQLELILRPIRVAEQSLPARFSELAEIWKRETAGEAFVTRKAMHWAYQRIIGLGPDALPLILLRLRQATDHWFWALAAIAGEDPAEGRETIDHAANTWIEWGRLRGFIE